MSNKRHKYFNNVPPFKPDPEHYTRKQHSWKAKPRRALFNSTPHSRLGKFVATEMCHEWRFRQVRQQRSGLRMVCVGERV